MPLSPPLPGLTSRQSDQLIRVLVEDPELVSSEGLHSVLPSNSGFIVFERSGTLDQVLADAESMAPCVLVASYDLVRRASTIDLRERLMKTRGARVLVRGAITRDVAELLLSQGVSGLIPRDVTGPLLRKAIRAVERGEIWAGRILLSRLLRRLQVRLATKDLSDREVEILESITEGLSNREIAEKLFICRETVRWHIRSLYSKIGVKDRAGAVRYGREFLVAKSGLLDHPSFGPSGDTRKSVKTEQIAAD